MDNKNHGLILRINHEHQIYTILDKNEGKINCKLKKQNFNYFCGLFISYRIETGKHNFKIHDIDIQASAKNIDSEKLKFIHILLELSLYFLPEAAHSPEIFDFLQKVILNIQNYSKAHKKIIICKLLALLGIIPEYSFREAYLNLILSFPIDTIIELEINLDVEQYLDKWIIEGVKSHPYAQRFKTVRFLEF